MKRWSIGANNYYFSASIYLEEAPWYIFMIEYSIQYICHYFPRIQLPNIKIIRDNEEYTLRSYYGTTGDLFHIYICTKIFNWCYDRIKLKTFEFPFEMLKNEFPDLFKDAYEYFDEKEVKDNLEYSMKIKEEFDVVYNKLENLIKTRMERKNAN